MVTPRRKSRGILQVSVETVAQWRLHITTVLLLGVASGLVATGIILLLMNRGPISVGNAVFTPRAKYAEDGPFFLAQTCSDSGTCVLRPSESLALGLSTVQPSITLNQTGDTLYVDTQRTETTIQTFQSVAASVNIVNISMLSIMEQNPYLPGNSNFTFLQYRKTYINFKLTISNPVFYITTLAQTAAPPIRPFNLWGTSGYITCGMCPSWDTPNCTKVRGIAYSSYLNKNRSFSADMPTNGTIICSGELVEFVNKFAYP